MLLYGRRNSVNVIPVLWCLEEIGVKYERRVVGGSFGGLDDDEFRALNPNGRIPVLEDDGFVLWESNAIVRYLADSYGKALRPRNHHDRARNDQWMEWYKTTFHPTFVALFRQFIRVEPAARDAGQIRALEQGCAELLRTPNDWLMRYPFLGGDRFGMGDIPLGAAVGRLFALPVLKPSLEGVERWCAALRSRQAYQATVMRPFGLTPAEHLALERADP